jgi:hypothetical protein
LISFALLRNTHMSCIITISQFGAHLFENTFNGTLGKTVTGADSWFSMGLDFESTLLKIPGRERNHSIKRSFWIIPNSD